ncbi:20S proteasome subunit [Rhizoctonia solani AG-1 IA]|uniref:20S proteasome subunit n=1 Tax=Thanatephorus cucumeris (strain AG1-IA) TaxID=983506 RepID=L8WQ60_THACA|nr:20S proteasome subunit [Rhizoctonia solani AG-1 IA]
MPRPAYNYASVVQEPCCRDCAVFPKVSWWQPAYHPLTIIREFGGSSRTGPSRSHRLACSLLLTASVPADLSQKSIPPGLSIPSLGLAGVDRFSIAMSSNEYYDESSTKTETKITTEQGSSVVSESRRSEFETLQLFGLPACFIMIQDRANIGNARVAGLQRDLKMTNHQYSTLSNSVPYIVCELPSNLLLKKLGPHRLLPGIVFTWGLVTALQGLVHSYSGLIATRFFLGLTEGGLLPGLVLYMSYFYRRDQLQLRVALLFSATSLAGAFSGLLAAAIVNLDGRHGRPGWAWIFILEGVFTALFGLFAFFVMPSSPRQVIGLSEAETEAINEMLRLDGNDGTGHEPFSWSSVFDAFKAPQVLLLCIPQGQTHWLSKPFKRTIHRELSRLLPGPHSVDDRPTICSLLRRANRLRVPLAQTNRHVLYGSLFLQIPGVYSSAPTLSAWMANNALPYYKRATAVALAFVFSNLGGIVSTWIFPDPPRYTTATRLNLACAAGLCVFAIIIDLYLIVQNKRKEAILASPEYGRNGEDSAEEQQRLGDKHPKFNIRAPHHPRACNPRDGALYKSRGAPKLAIAFWRLSIKDARLDMSRSYDRALTVFSPDGHLFQSSDMPCPRKLPTPFTLIDRLELEGRMLLFSEWRKNPFSNFKTLELCAKSWFTGLTADGRVLIDKARIECQSYRLTVEDPVSVEYITRHIAGIQQRYTQSGGVRPFGISTLIIGFDPNDARPRLYMTEPSGIYSAWKQKANAIGRSSKTVREFLEKNHRDDMTREEAIKLTVKSLLEVVQTGAKNIEISVMESYGKVTNLDLSQVEAIVSEIEREKEAGMSSMLKSNLEYVYAHGLSTEAERKRSRVAATAASQAAMAAGISGSAPPSGPVTGANTPRPGA